MTLLDRIKIKNAEARHAGIEAAHSRMAENVRILREAGKSTAAAETARDYYKRTGRILK